MNFYIKNFFLFAGILVFAGCNKEEPADIRLLPPFMLGTIGDRQVTLTYFSDLRADILLPYRQVAPDYFDIYEAAGRPERFTKVLEIKNTGEYTCSIDRLFNNTSYFFYAVGRKEGYAPLYSDTIMLIPNEKPVCDTLVILLPFTGHPCSRKKQRPWSGHGGMTTMRRFLRTD
jgi:hypothetical protein